MYRGYDPYGFDMPPPWFFQAMYQNPPHHGGGGRNRGRGRNRRGNDDFFKTIKRWENYQEAKKKREKGKDDKSPKGWAKAQMIAGEVGRLTLLGIPTGLLVLSLYGGVLYAVYKIVSELAK